MPDIGTTAGVIAVGNLEARIAGQERASGRLTVAECAELVELVALRGQVWAASRTPSGPRRWWRSWSIRRRARPGRS